MPLKKSTGGQKNVIQEPTILPEGGDPTEVAVAIIDKKKRNLEKRKNKLESLREGLDSGNTLDKDQLAAVAKLDEVVLQLELIKDLQKQFITLQFEYQRNRKKAVKAERVAARESEREAERRVVSYTLRVQDLLNNFGEDDRENFRTGTNGAVLLSEDELSQLDELYTVLTPVRRGNPSYMESVDKAGEFVQQLMEQSSKEVFGTSYKQLYELLQRIEDCGYFDQSPSDNGEDEESGQEEVVLDDEDYKSAEDTLPPDNEGEQEEFDRNTGTPVDPPYVPPTPTESTLQQESSSVIQPNMISGYIPSAPSPTFPGLGPSPVLPTAGDGFSFMHDSEVDRGSIQAVQPAPPSSTQINSTRELLPTDPQIQAPAISFPQYRTQNMTEDMQKLGIVPSEGNVISHPIPPTAVEQSGGELGTTDVATGQPSQNEGYQSLSGGGLMSSAPPPSSSYQYGGGAMGDISAGYQQLGAPVRVGGGQQRSGRGARRGSAPKSSGGMYRNGRGVQGGYDVTGYPANRGYSGGGYPRGGGGRANYRTAQQGTRK